MPEPCTLDDLFDARELGFPTKLLFRFFRRGDQPGRIARAPGFFDNWYWMLRHFAAGVDNLSNGCSSTGTQVKRSTALSRESQDMS